MHNTSVNSESLLCISGANVTLTDRKMALEILHENVKLNSEHFTNGSIDIEELEWGRDDYKFLLQHKPYDYVIGADIVYIEETFPLLRQTLVTLCVERTVGLLASKIRYSKDSLFYESLNQWFQVTKVLYDKSTDIHIYSLVKKT